MAEAGPEPEPRAAAASPSPPAAQCGDDDLVEQTSCPFDDLEMSVVNGVERPRDERNPHETPFSVARSGRATVTMVPP